MSPRGQLALMLRDCPRCEKSTHENIALILGQSGKLSDEQVEKLLEQLSRVHKAH